MDKFPYQSCVSVIKSRKMEQIQSTYWKIYIAREKGVNILSYVDFSKLCYVIPYFSELNQ